MIFRKLVLVTLVFMLSFTLFSCRGDDDEDVYPIEEGATVIRIFVRDFEDWNNEFFAQRIRNFNEDLTDGIQVEVEFIIESVFNDRMNAAREAGTAPDIYLAAYNQVYNEMRMGFAAPLDDLLPQAAFDDITSNIKPALVFNDQYYAYPYFVEPSTLLFYSKSMLTAAGVEHPVDRWTWQELLDAAEALQDTLMPGQYALGMPLGGDAGWATWGMVYNVLDGFPITENWDASRISNNRDAYTRYLEFIKEIFDNGYAPMQSLTPRGYGEIIVALAEGQLAMTVGGSWSLGTVINEYPEILDDLGVIPLPTEDGNPDAVTATNGGWAFLIDSNSPNKEKAAAVLEYLVASEDVSELASFFELAGYSRFPARYSVQTYLEDRAQENPFFSVINHVSNHAVLEPLYPWDISVRIATSYNTMVIGMGPGETINQIVTQTHAGINEIISSRNLAGSNPHHQP